MSHSTFVQKPKPAMSQAHSHIKAHCLLLILHTPLIHFKVHSYLQFTATRNACFLPPFILLLINGNATWVPKECELWENSLLFSLRGFLNQPLLSSLSQSNPHLFLWVCDHGDYLASRFRSFQRHRRWAHAAPENDDAHVLLLGP